MNNIQEIEDIIKKSKEKKVKVFFDNLEKSFKESLLELKFPEQMEISNLDDLLEKINSFPSSFTIDNLKDLVQYIKFPEQKDFPVGFNINNPEEIAKYIKIPKQTDIPAEFKIKNLKDIKFEKVELPENLKDLSFRKTENYLKNIYDKFVLLFVSLKDGFFISNKKPSEAIPVRMVTKDGKDFTEFRQTIMGVGGGGTSTDMTGVETKLDTLNSQIATEETLQSIAGFDIPKYDYVALGYTGSNLTTVQYYQGGSGGTLVGTLTLAYSGSDIINITKT
jgi:hypothetical protein